MSASLPFDPIAEARRNWQRRGWPEPTVMAAVTSITRAHQLLLKRIDEVLRPLELTFARYEALVLLEFSRAGQLPLGRMGRRLQVHPASVTNAVDRLEAAGLVERVAHPTDGRTTLARITEQGRCRVAAATEALGAARFGADGLSEDDAEALVDRLIGLRRAAGDF